ncbi:copper resistance CopC family protein [Planobispora rosea]|uniref:copper resistance CopC family protein n=1 Tax=Planobispora rosea TaxID=35762 RepID=UPI00083B5C33|nr:copper resistance CopC family protein [Planobispora rosea]
MKTSPFAAALTLLAALVLSTVPAAPALAHDTLKSSDPAKGKKVEDLERVKLTFTASVRFPKVVVRSADGTPYQDGKPASDGPVVTQEVKPDLPPGEYVIAYRVVSSDGHPIEGEIPFTLTGSATPSAVAQTPGASRSASPDEDAAGAATPEPTPESTPEPEVSRSPVPLTPAPAADGKGSGGVPGWAWIVVGGLGGVGIGMFLSMRNKKQP